MRPRLSVIGLGKLGACTAACLASKGFEVIGVDINKDFVDAINNGKAPIYEPKLQELIDLSRARLRATQDYEEVIKESDITFLIVPTPSREDGHFSDKYLKDALSHLSTAFKKLKKMYHIFVITSTVSPGTTEGNLIPLIESISSKKLNKDFGVAYNPEFIALGNVITDFLNPDIVLIGESDKTVGDKLEEIYMTVCENKPYIARMSIISAEITKISLNSYITMKISFANTLANICERIPDANIDDITKALGADKRISPYYLKGGLSYGGPCFPRDNRAFSAFAMKYGVDAKLAKTTDEVNLFQIHHLADLVLKQFSETNHRVVAVLGLSYKPNTPVIEESPSIRLIEELLKRDLEVIVYDSFAMDNARALFGDNILYASSIKDCLSHSSICVISTQAEEFKSIDRSYITHNPTTVIDCWRMLNPEKLGSKVKYIPLGKCKM
ncbi:MAG: UDP-glucose dehydrogenase family protein [Thermodesulfovibrionales bacterium]